MFFRRAARPNVPPELTLTRRTKSTFHRVARGMLRKVKKRRVFEFTTRKGSMPFARNLRLIYPLHPYQLLESTFQKRVFLSCFYAETYKNKKI